MTIASEDELSSVHPMPPLGHLSPREEEEEEVEELDEEQDKSVINLAVSNPSQPGYVVPSNKEEMGELQMHVCNMIASNPKRKKQLNQYIIMVSFAAMQLDLDPDNFPQPYQAYMEHFKNKNSRWNTLMPTKKLLAEEIIRRNPRAKINQKNTLLQDLYKELLNLKFEDPKDHQYALHEERKLRLLISEMLGEKTKARSKSAAQTFKDRMRLICAFEDDNIVMAYRLSQEVMTRSQLDARNSEVRLTDFYDLIVSKFNDDNWVPKSIALPDLHSDFAEEKEWPKRQVYTLDREKAKAIFSWFKGASRQMLQNYNQSGNGAIIVDDMYQIGDDNNPEPTEFHAKYGHFDLELAMTKEGGDDRKNFLNGQPTDLLYWWHILDQLDLITMTCVAMKEELGATSGKHFLSIAELASAKKRRQEREDLASITQTASELQHNLENMTSTLNELVNHAKYNRLDSLKNKVIELKRERLGIRKEMHTASEDYKVDLENYLDDLSSRIDELEQEIDN